MAITVFDVASLGNMSSRPAEEGAKAGLRPCKLSVMNILAICQASQCQPSIQPLLFSAPHCSRAISP